jgi:hypothetical protein
MEEWLLCSNVAPWAEKTDPVKGTPIYIHVPTGNTYARLWLWESGACATGCDIRMISSNGARRFFAKPVAMRQWEAASTTRAPRTPAPGADEALFAGGTR